MSLRLPAPLRPIYIQVLIAIILAVIFGLVWPEEAKAMKPLGDGFVALLKILIGPIIFCTVVLGLTQISDLSRLGRVALKALVYFEVVSTLALVTGMIVGNVFEPGAGLHSGTSATGSVAASIAGYQAGAAKAGGFVEFVLALIPKTFVSAFSEGEILQILLLSILFGSAAALLGGQSTKTLGVIAEVQKLMFKMLGFIMRLAPIGAFGAMAFTVGTHGGATLFSLLKLIFLVYATCLAFIFIVLAGIAAACGLSIFNILRMIREELLLVLGTASSEVALPRLLEKLERAGCEKSVVGLVLPTGYAFNTDGTAIYMSMAVIFISQATDTPLSITQQLGLLAILLFTSKGGAAISGAGFVKLAATLSSVRTLPMTGLGLLIGVDRFMSEARALTNMVGNTVAVLAVARWEGAFDKAKFDAYIKNPDLGDDFTSAAPEPQPTPVAAPAGALMPAKS